MQLTDDQQMIRDSARAFVADASNPAVLQTWTADQTQGDPAVWARIRTELGWPATLVPEALDGLGLGIADICLILEESGAALLNAPVWSSALLSTALLQMAIEPTIAQPVLRAMAAGEITVTSALPVDGIGYRAGSLPVWDRLAQGDTDMAIWPLVPDARTADRLLLPVHLSGGRLGWLLVAASAVEITPHKTWDLSRPLASVRLKAEACKDLSPVQSARCIPGTVDALHCAGLGQAAELTGAIARCLQVTLDYVRERVQFGRPVGGFQAVKHRCAQIMVELETTRSAVAAALVDLPGLAQISAEGLTPLQRADIAAAVSQAKDAAFFAAQEAIQLHGGVGFTWEYEPHFHFKRAQSASSLLGTAEQWRECIAAHLLD